MNEALRSVNVNYVLHSCSQKMMGPRKRCCVTRTAAFTPTPISAIFWGQLRSVLHQAGGHTTANLQPFTTLPLDIQVGNVLVTRVLDDMI